MKMNEFEVVQPGAAQPLPIPRAERGRREALAARIKARLSEIWVGWYAQPPRRLPLLV